jgi:hypothetical protein
MAMTTGHRIDDLARPWLPWPIWTLNRMLAPLAGWVRLEAYALLSTAIKKTGLTDFGDDRFREPLRVLVDALEHEAELTPLGRLLWRQLLLQLLMTQLHVQHLVIYHPEILELPVWSPIVIVGLPRTGTTHLHNLMSRDPHLRSLPFWESLQPVLPSEKQSPSGQPDPRMKYGQRSLRLLTYMMPLYPLMHEMAWDLPHEEIQLLAVDFSTMFFEWSSYVPGYCDWYQAHDQTATYTYLHTLLQVLQWSRGGAHLVLKSPQHLEQLRPLFKVFPDAKIVQTHRDPVAVTASLCTMLAYVARMYTERVDLLAMGRYWSLRIEDLLRAAVRDRPHVAADQVLDVCFQEFMTDELSMMRRVYQFAQQPMTEEAQHAIESFLTANPRGKLGRIEYHLEDFGLDRSERRQALRFYQERFDVPDE